MFCFFKIRRAEANAADLSSSGIEAAVYGLLAEIEDAQKTAHATLAAGLQSLSEQDLACVHAAGVIAEEDHRQALAAKRWAGWSGGVARKGSVAEINAAGRNGRSRRGCRESTPLHCVLFR